MVNSRWSVLIVGVMVLSCAAVASAQAQGAISAKDTKDIKEIAQYKLTTEGLEKFAKVAKALDELSKKDPSLKEKSLNSDNEQQTIDETVAGYQKYPQLISTIKSAGFTPREFVVFSYALMANSFAMAYKQAGMKEVPPGATAANIDFIEKHQKEIQALGVGDKKPSGGSDQQQ